MTEYTCFLECGQECGSELVGGCFFFFFFLCISSPVALSVTQTVQHI